MQDRRPRLSFVAGALAAVALASMAGCGLTVQQHTAVRKFAAATATLADLAGEHLTDSRAAVVQMNLLRAKLGDAALPVDPGADDDVTAAQLAGFLKDDHLSTRLAALGALRTYAELLEALAGHSEPAALRTSVDAFVTSLQHARLITLEPAQATAATHLASFAAGQIVEAQRADALRRVVRDAEPIVLRVIELLRADLEVESEQWAFACVQTAHFLEQAATIAMARAGGPGAVDPLAVEARITAQRCRSTFAQRSRQLLAAAEQLRLAQVNLRGALQSPRVSVEDLDALVSHMQQTVDAIAVIRTMR